MRLFIAVDLLDEVRRELAGVIDRLRPAAPHAKWVPPENLHLTLVFLGEVADDRLGEIELAVRAGIAGRDPVPTSLAATGAFPRAARARVLWAGMSDEAGGLAALAESCAASMQAIGFPREARAWKPHLTLARFRDPADISRMPSAAVRPVAFAVREVTTFRSRLGRPAPRYEAVARAPLGGASGSARSAGT